MNEIAEKIKILKTRDDFVEVVGLLVKDLENNPEGWENITLKDYFEAIAAWTEDMDGYYKNMNLPVPFDINWKVFADILVAGKMYE